MNNKEKRQKERKKEQKELMGFIIILLILFIAMIFLDKKFRSKVERRPFEGEIRTYDGSLQRNISHPLGLE